MSIWRHFNNHNSKWNRTKTKYNLCLDMEWSEIDLDFIQTPYFFVRISLSGFWTQTKLNPCLNMDWSGIDLGFIRDLSGIDLDFFESTWSGLWIVISYLGAVHKAHWPNFVLYWLTTNPLLTLSCQRSLWTAPYLKITWFLHTTFKKKFNHTRIVKFLTPLRWIR